MRWLILALSVVCLSVGAAVWVLLFVVSESALSERRGESAAAAQYDGEGDGHVRPPRGATPVRSEVEDANTDYYTAYARWLEQENNALEASRAGSSDPVSEGSISGASAPAE